MTKRDNYNKKEEGNKMFSLKILTIGLIVIISYPISAQTYNSYETKKDILIDGSENPDFTGTEVIVKNSIDRVNPVYGDYFTYNYHNITDRKTGYDLQSNASTQQVWYDLNNDFMHAVFTNSQTGVTPWADRTCLYFGSTDAGITWFELGGVPVNTGTSGRSGFPAIYGTSTGRAVIANHNNSDGTTTHTKIFVDNNPFEYNFATHDAGDVAQGFPIWPRLVVNQQNDVVFVSSINITPDYPFTNHLDLPGGTFLGYNEYEGTTAEQYALAISSNGKIGMAFNGSADENNDGDVFYWESTDGGINWSFPVKIFDRPDGVNVTLGAMRGVSCSFFGEVPCVVFEIIEQDFSAGTYFPGLPSEILFWSPTVNGGISKVIVDTTIVPFAPSQGTNDVMSSYCRPVIGRSESGGFLFVAFNVATDETYPSADPTTYFAGYFMYSDDGGVSWSIPEKFTPETPLVDWRYISIAPVNPVVGDLCTVHMVAQGDTIPGSTVNALGMPVGVTAQYYHISTEPILIPVELTSFTAELDDYRVVLQWQTVTETNNQGFEIQRKLTQSNSVSEWTTIGFKEGHGTTTEPQYYSFNDDVGSLHALSFTYRLKQVDYDGNFEYSEEVTVENSTLPDKYSFSQNYPNPFNPSTTIEFTLPQKEFVTIKLYDVLGNEVKTLLDEEVDAGLHKLEFNASELTSGVYIYQLKVHSVSGGADSFTQTRKMTLMK
jgi:hypothetical protein